MTRALLIFALLGSALGQITVKGSITTSGISISAGFQATYSAYTGNAIVTPWPTIPDMGGLIKNNAVWHDTSYPSGVAPPVTRCTDSATSPAGTFALRSYSAGYGGSGDALQLFNADDSLVLLNRTGGAGIIAPIGASNVCSPAVTSDKNQTNPGSPTVIFNFGNGTFDWTNRLLYYQYNGTHLDAFTFTNVVTGTFTGPVTVAALELGLPLGSNASAWQNGHAYTTGQYVSVTGSWPDWAANHTYNPGDIILPTANNVWGCAFYMSQATAKVSGSSPPSFSTTPQGQCTAPNLQLITDNTAKWRNLSGNGTFTYQLTSAGGTSGASFALPANPQLLTTVTDNGMTWTNTGVAYTPAWNSYGGISKNSTRTCAGFSNNGYAWNNNFTGTTGDQDTGQYAVCYDSVANKYHLFNTLTNTQSSTTCSGGSGYNCLGGSISMTYDGSPTGFAGCGVFVHNVKGSMNGDYQLISHLADLASNTCTNAAVWRPFETFNAATAIQITAGKFSHAAIGVSHLQALFSSETSFYGANSGVMGMIYDMASPGTTPVISVQNSPCAYPFTSGLPPPCAVTYWDQHMGWAYHPDTSDSQPACGTIYNYQTLSPIPIAPWQGEEVCMSTSPTWNNTATPGAQTAWRFAHTLATGANTFFDAQFQISSMSGTGKRLAFTSDWGCTLGSSDGSATVCGAPWLPGFTYNLNDMVAPIGQTQGTGAIYDVFKVTTPGTSGASFPGYATPALAWAHCTNIPGCTVTDSNGVVYTDVNGNPSNARADVFIVQLAP